MLRQVTELKAMVGESNQAFSPGPAEGAQLEALAASLGLSRVDIVTDKTLQKRNMKRR
jgi:hypothetical protein